MPLFYPEKEENANARIEMMFGSFMHKAPVLPHHLLACCTLLHRPPAHPHVDHSFCKLTSHLHLDSRVQMRYAKDGCAHAAKTLELYSLKAELPTKGQK